MRTTWLLLSTLLLLALVPSVAAYHDGFGGEAPNRAPIANAGPDFTVIESDLILLDAVGSFDPDADDDGDLEYVWRVQQAPRVPAPNGTPGYFVDQPLQVGQKCIFDELGIDLEDWQYAYHGPYMEPGVPDRLTYVFNVSVYDREVDTVEDMYPIRYPNGTINKDATDEQKALAWRNYTNHKSWDHVTVTILNGNQAPHGYHLESNGSPKGLCEEPLYVSLEITPTDADIWDHQDDAIEFLVEGYDDKAIGAVEVYLYHETVVDAFEKAGGAFACQIDVVPETYRFGLGLVEKEQPPGTGFGPGMADPSDPGGQSDYPSQIYRGQINATFELKETWGGRLPMKTPELVEGSYRVCARAFDTEGGSVISDPEEGELSITQNLEKGQSPPCLSILQPGVQRAITPEVPEEFPPKEAIKEFKCSYPTTPPDTKCSVFPEQILGAGGVIRLEVAVIPRGLPGEGGYEPNTTFLIHHVTIQNEVEGVTRDQVPEIRLKSPYFINLDTLAETTTRIHVRAYDRVGGVAEICIPVTADARNPVVLAEVPDTMYRGLQSTAEVYIQDKVAAQSVLRIHDFDPLDATGAAPDYVLFRNTSEADILVLPPLLRTVFPRIDINGDGYMDILYDSRTVATPALLTNGEPIIYDRYWDHKARESHTLIQKRCDGDKINDYLHDLDGNNKCDPGEPVVLGADRRTDIDGINPNVFQLVAEDIKDDLSIMLEGGRTYVVTHEVTPTTFLPLGDYPWTVTVQDKAGNRIVVRGSLALERYSADVFVERVGFKQFILRNGTEVPFNGTGLLPGDVVLIDAVIGHRSGLVASPEIPIFYAFGDDPFTKWTGDLIADALHLEAARSSGKVQMAMCEQTIPSLALTFELPCLLKIGDNVTVPYTGSGIFPPGEHTLRVSARGPPVVIETVPANNTKTFAFEVYLGRADVGEDRYYIRAGPNGLPRTTDGVIDLSTNRTYDLRLDDHDGSVYLFDVDDETYYWDPLERHNIQTDEPCMRTTDPSSAFGGLCRPITKVDEDRTFGPDPTKTKKSPGPGPLLILALAGAGLALRRRSA